MTDNTPGSAGARFRQALVEESPLQIVGTINANHALLAKRAGYRAAAWQRARWACRTSASRAWTTS